MVGGYSFIGGGVYHATAAPVYALAATAAEFGGVRSLLTCLAPPPIN